MNQADLERLYEAMARQIDSVGVDHAPLYLAKLALLLAHHLDDPEPRFGPSPTPPGPWMPDRPGKPARQSNSARCEESIRCSNGWQYALAPKSEEIPEEAGTARKDRQNKGFQRVAGGLTNRRGNIAETGRIGLKPFKATY